MFKFDNLTIKGGDQSKFTMNHAKHDAIHSPPITKSKDNNSSKVKKTLKQEN